MAGRLSTADLFPRGPLRRLGKQVLLFDELDSTNGYLLARAAALPDGTVASAEYQTAGRGRLGRRWEAPRGSSILLSVLLKEPADSHLIRRATLIGALAACEAIEQATLCRPTLRWPNDLLLASRKLGGVLVESSSVSGSAAGEARQRVVGLGIGINCLQQAGHFPADLVKAATSLEIESAQAVDRAAIAGGLLARLDELLSGAAREDSASLLAAWKARCEAVGTRVVLQENRRTYEGTVLDLSDDGDLLVQLDEGGRRYFASATTTRLR